MQAAPYDPSYLDKTVSVLDSMHAHRIQHPINKSDEMFYKAIGDYFRAIRDASSLGKKLVWHSAMLPTELFYAMDIVPAMWESVVTIINFSNAFEEGFAAAKAYGLPPEICSSHRLMLGAVLNGWIPRPDAMVWSWIPCDNTAKSSDIIRRLWNCPGHMIDRGRGFNERELAYFIEEMQEAIEFLEGITGRKMDYERLSECMARSREVMLLEKEMEALRNLTPSPLRARSGMITQMANHYLLGTQVAVDMFRQVRDEAKQRVETGQHPGGEEKYRLEMYMQPPIYAWKILDWMTREHGAVIVSDPLSSFWGDGDFDPAKPVEALARKSMIRNGMNNIGPIEMVTGDMVRGAKEANVEGALTFTHVGCRNLSPCNRAVKDAIGEATGLPFFVVEDDMSDPAFCSEEELRDKVECFLEMLDERRR